MWALYLNPSDKLWSSSVDEKNQIQALDRRWTLQDDSGNFRRFAGTMSADGGHVDFRQTDPGAIVAIRLAMARCT